MSRIDKRTEELHNEVRAALRKVHATIDDDDLADMAAEAIDVVRSYFEEPSAPAGPWWDSHPRTVEERDRLRQALWKQSHELAAARNILIECPCSYRVSLEYAFRCRHCGLVLCRRCADRHFGPGPKTWDPDWKAENERARCAGGAGGEDVAGRIIEKVLCSYRLQHTLDEDGEHLPLLDALTPPGAESVDAGNQEIEILADAVACALEGPFGEWVDCPEKPPAAGWYWFRQPGSDDLKPVNVSLKEGGHYVGDAAWPWRVWCADGWQIWTIPLTVPPTTPPAEKREAPPRPLEKEPCTCYLGACHRDRLGEGWYCQLEEQILNAKYEPAEPDPPPWRCAVCGRPGDRAEDGVCPCGSEEWVDFGADDELDLERRVSEAHTGIGAIVIRLDDHEGHIRRLEERLDRAEKAMADALSNPEERVARLVSAEVEKSLNFFRSRG